MVRTRVEQTCPTAGVSDALATEPHRQLYIFIYIYLYIYTYIYVYTI